MAAHGKCAERAGGRGAPSNPLPTPGARVRPPQTAAIGDRLSPPSRGTREHPYGKPGRDWDRPPESPDCTSFFFCFLGFFFPLNRCISSHSARAPPPVFSFQRVAGLFTCWRSSPLLQVYFK